MSDHNQFTRRGLLKTAGGLALVSGISAPAILRAQTADVIKIGHLTPRTGFLGPLGEYAVMAADLDDVCGLGAQNSRRGNPRHQRDAAGGLQQAAARELTLV